MAETLRLVLEPDIYNDAVSALVGTLAALERRHGDRFRDLERRIEAVAQVLPPPDLRELGPKDDSIIILALPPVQLVELLEDAKRLQVRPIIRG